MGLRKRLRLAVGRSRDPPDERNVPTSSNTPRVSPSPRPPSESREESQPPNAGPTSSPEDLPAAKPKARLDAWNKAYDDLKSTDPKLVSEYERLLCQEPGGEDAPAQDTSSPQTEIDHAGLERRRQQMENIAQTALDRTAKEARGTKRAEEVMGVVDLARELGAPVIQTFPQAALPWAGVCAALQLFKNPITESKAQRDGMVHVITRMKWYCELENQLSRKIDNGKESDSGLLNLLEDKIVTLYTALLTFLMRSVCSYFKNRILAGLRNALKLDQWEDSLKEIKKSEEDIYRDVEYQNLTEVNSNLREILAFAKEKESQFFENVLTVMQAQLTLQLSQLDQQCLKDVLLQDPRIAKEEIEDVKGGLFEESCEWVFENDDFRKWHEEDDSRALWIHGDPGKGKTMLLCGIINSIQHRLPQTDTLSYFFCQADQPNSNTFTAVLRGLVYDLARKRPDLIKHVREVYDVKGTKLFTDNGSWADLSQILTQMISTLDQGTTYLLIDALDECQEDRDRLMKFIINQASEQPKLRWIVTSRNWSSIGSFFEKNETVRSLSLENNADLISLAVRGYISYQVNSLAHEKGYDDGFRAQVETHLLSKAEETYLWVALVCKALRDTEGDSFWAEEALNEFPGGLDDLYSKMMNQVTQGKQAELCRQVLSCVALVRRPITLLELVVCIDLTPTLRSKALSEERLASVLKPIVNLCGSFLKIRNETVYFVHQSAKEYLNGPHAGAIFPEGVSHAHLRIFHRSITSLMKGLHRDMYHLEAPGSLDSFGIHIDGVKRPLNNSLSACSYSCVYWVDHLASGITGSDGQPKPNTPIAEDEVQRFLEERFLYWLEAMSLLGAIPEAIQSMGKLLEITRTYASALVFSPTRSLVKNSFKGDMPTWVDYAAGLKDEWDTPCFTLRPMHWNFGSVALSHNKSYIAIVITYQNCFDIYELASSRFVRTIRPNIDEESFYIINCLAFSHDDKAVVFATATRAYIMDTATGLCLQTIYFENRDEFSQAIFFSEDDDKVFVQRAVSSASNEDNTTSRCRIWVWYRALDAWIQRTDLSSLLAHSMTRDLCVIKRFDDNSSLEIRNFTTGATIATLRNELDSSSDIAATFSPDGQLIAIYAKSIEVLRSSSGELIRTIHPQNMSGSEDPTTLLVCFSNDNRLIAHKLWRTILVTDITTGACLQCVNVDWGFAPSHSLFFVNNAHQLLEAGELIRIWDVTHSTPHNFTRRPMQSTQWMYLSAGGEYLVWQTEGKVEIFDINNKSRHTVAPLLEPYEKQLITADGMTLFGRNKDDDVLVLDIRTSKCIQKVYCQGCRWFASSDGRLIAVVKSSTYGSSFSIVIWCVASGVRIQEFQIVEARPSNVLFSPNNDHIVVRIERKRSFQVFEVRTGEFLCAIELENPTECFEFFNHQRSFLLMMGSRIEIRSLMTGQIVSTLLLPRPPGLAYESSYRNTLRIVISQDDKLLARIENARLFVWDIEKGTFQRPFDSLSFTAFNSLSFRGFHPFHFMGPSNWALRMPVGDIGSVTQNDRQLHMDGIPFTTYSGLGFDEAWITWKGVRILVLPEEYGDDFSRTRKAEGKVVVEKQVVAIATPSGMVILKFNLE